MQNYERNATYTMSYSFISNANEEKKCKQNMSLSYYCSKLEHKTRFLYYFVLSPYFVIPQLLSAGLHLGGRRTMTGTPGREPHIPYQIPNNPYQIWNGMSI